jgi:hypothetical protein
MKTSKFTDEQIAMALRPGRGRRLRRRAMTAINVLVRVVLTSWPTSRPARCTPSWRRESMYIGTPGWLTFMRYHAGPGCEAIHEGVVLLTRQPSPIGQTAVSHTPN